MQLILNKPRLQTLICVLFLMALPFTLFFSQTLGGKTLLPADNLFQYEPFHSSAATFNATQPQNELLSDLILENYAWKRFILNALNQPGSLTDKLPLWNPYLFGGVPFLAAGQHSMLYPLSVLYYAFPLASAYGWFTVVNLGLAGVFMFLMMRTFGAPRGAATFAGVAYQLSGFFIVSVVFQMVIASAAWLPLIIAMCERVLQQSPALKRASSSAPWALVGAFAIAMQILAGHVEITVYTLLVAALFSVWRWLTLFPPRETRWRVDGGYAAARLVWLAVMVLLGIGLSAVQLVPLFELVTSSFRAGRSDFAQVLSYGFPLRYITQWLLPNFYGNPAQHTYFDLFTLSQQAVQTARGDTAWGIKNYVEGGAYVGVLTLIVAIIGAGRPAHLYDRRVNAPRGFFIALAFFSVLFIFGTPAYAILYYGLPGVNQLHSPFRWVFPLTFCLAALAGLGFAVIESQRARLTASVRLISVAGIIFGIALAVITILARMLWSAAESVIMRLAAGADKFNAGMSAPKQFFSLLAPQLLWLAFLLIAGFVVVRWMLRTRHANDARIRLAPSLLLIALLALDLAVAWHGFNPSVDPTLLSHTPDAIKFLQQDKTLWRLTTYEASGTKPLNANAAWLFDLQDVRGYDSIIPSQYVKYVSLIEPQGELPFNRIAPIHNEASLQSPLLDLLNVKYVLTVDTINQPGYSKVFDDGTTRIYQNMRVLPRAFTLPITSGVLSDNFSFSAQKFDPRKYVIIDLSCGITDIGCTVPQPADYKPANVTSYKNNEVWIDVDVSEPSWLMLTDSYFAGWRAYVRPRGGDDASEREVQIGLANGNFRAVMLQPNENSTAQSNPLNTASAINKTPTSAPHITPLTVRFKYTPDSLRIGAFASVIAMMSLLLLAAIYIWRTLQNRAHSYTSDSGVRRVARNSFILTALNLSARIIDMAFAFVMLRVLGPAGAGNYQFAVILVSWFEILMNFGLNTFLIRDAARDREHAVHYLYNTTLLRLMLALIAAPLVALVILFYVWLDGISIDTRWTIALLVLSQLPGSLATGLSALFFAYEKAEVPATLTIVSALIKVVIGAMTLFAGYGIVGLAITSIITNLFTLTALMLVARRTLHLRFSRAEMTDAAQADTPRRTILRESFPLMINHLLSTIFFKVDVPLLKAITRDAATVGFYSVGYKYVDAFNIIPSLFTQSLFPALSRMAGESKSTSGNTPFARAYILAVKLLLMLALPLSIAVTTLATPLIALLGGNAFLPQGAIALAIVIWHMPIGWINSVTNYALIAVGQQRALTRAFVGAVAFNILANLIAIPLYGYIGAAVVTALSEVAQLLTFYIYVRSAITKVNWLTLLSKPVLAAVLMALTCAMFTWLGRAGIGVIVGGLIYLAALFVLRAFDSHELDTLRPLLPKRLATQLT